MPSLSLVASLRGHTGVVWSVAWSPLGLLASCGTDRTVRIWHSSSEDESIWKCIVSFNNDTFVRTVRDLSWSSDGRSLTCACFDAVAYVLELFGGKVPHLEAAVSLEGHDSEVKGVCYSSGGALLATCSRDRSVWIWEAGLDYDYECIAVLNGHTADIKTVVWHPCVEMLVSCSYDGTMRVWVEDDDDWFCSETLAAHSGTVWSAAFDKDGSGLVSVAEDGGIVVWERRDPPSHVIGAQPCFRVVARKEDVHDGPVYCVDWNKNNSLIATCGGDDAINIIRVVDPRSTSSTQADETMKESNPGVVSANSGEPEQGSKKESAQGSQEEGKSSHEQAPESSKDSADHSEDAITTRLTQKCEVLTTVPRAHTGDVNRVAWNPINSNLLATCGDDGLVRIWRYDKEGSNPFVI